MSQYNNECASSSQQVQSYFIFLHRSTTDYTHKTDWRILNDIEIALRISGIAVVSSIAIPETVSLSLLQFQVSHNTNKNVGCGILKMAIICTYGSNNWETVEDRWVHAAKGLASTELSFHPRNILRDNRRASPGETKMWAAVRENGDFWHLRFE